MPILNDFLNLDKCRAPKRDSEMRAITVAQGRPSEHDYRRRAGEKADPRAALARNANAFELEQQRQRFTQPRHGVRADRRRAA